MPAFEDLPRLSATGESDPSQLYRRRAFPFISEGTLYAFPLQEDLNDPRIEPGASALVALVAADAPLVYGLTRGERCHLCHWHPAFGVVHVATLSETPVSGGALARGAAGWIAAGWWGASGGGLVRHATRPDGAQGLEQFRGCPGTPEPVPLPQEDMGVCALAGDPGRGLVYGLTRPHDLLVALAVETGELRPLAVVEGAAPVLAVLPDGSLLGATREGRLWTCRLESGVPLLLDSWAPCQQGKRYAAGVECLLVARDGTVYGGTAIDGFLFRFDPGSGDVTNLGKPNRQSHLRALTEGPGGLLFGAVQEPGGMAHLFTYDPASGSFHDLGVPAAAFVEYWIAHRIGALCTGGAGEIFFGEDDQLAHLFVYYPPYPEAGRAV